MVTEIRIQGIIFHVTYSCGVSHTVEGVKVMEAVWEGVILRFESNVI